MKITKSSWINEIEEENIYSEKSRNLMVEDDEMTPEEAAFMQGWDEAG